MSNRILLLPFLLLCLGLQAQHSQCAAKKQIYVCFRDAGMECATWQIADARESWLQQRIQAPVDSIRSSFFLSQSPVLRRTWRIYLTHTEDREAVLQRLNALPEVNYAEAVPDLHRFDTPNDLGPNTTTTGGQWYLYKIKAQQAWDIQTGSPIVRVAVLDDAVETLHEELSGLCLPGYDAAQLDFNVEPPTTAHDHGTFIAGLIGANTNNGLGMASLARGIRILPVKIALDANPDAVAAGYEGMDWAITQNAQIINASWGAGDYSQTGLQVCQNALNSNILVVASAGNFNNEIPMYPAAYPGVLSVASTTVSDVRSGFSNYGSWVDVSAPGSQIWSLAPQNQYTVKSGTSFSGPLVAGLAALMKSYNSLLTVDEMQQCILNSADPIDQLNTNMAGLLGTGRINAQQALFCLQQENVGFNLALMGIESPEPSRCGNAFQAAVRVKNTGNQVLSAFRLRSILNTQAPVFADFSVDLQPGEDTLVQLPMQQAVVGLNTLRINQTDVLNGSQPDAYSADNLRIAVFRVQHPTGQTLPFTEDFENVTLDGNRWTRINEQGQDSWEIVNAESGVTGDWAARLPYYRSPANGSRDYLVSPSLDLRGYSSATLEYDYAYMPRFAGLTDTLILSVSSNCGQSWTRLQTLWFGGSPNLATTPVSSENFAAVLPSQWCGSGVGVPACASVNLAAYLGSAGLQFRFEGISQQGNNIYIDNIQISGTALAAAPTCGWTTAGTLPSCVNSSVLFLDTTANLPTTLQWTFEGGTPALSNSSTPTVTYSAPGSYDVQLIASNAHGSDTLLLSDYVSIEPAPVMQATLEPDTLCPGGSASISVTGANSYIWNALAGLSGILGDSVIVTPASTTTYVVNGYSAAGCVSSLNVPVVVLPNPPTPSVTTDGYALTAGSGVHFLWYVDGNPITASDTISWVPQQNGNYNVMVTDAYGCTAFSPVFPVTWAALERVHAGKLHAYPVPSSGLVWMEFPVDATRVQLYDAYGRCLLHVPVQNGSLQVDLSAWTSGVYWAVCFDRSGMRSRIPLIRN